MDCYRILISINIFIGCSFKLTLLPSFFLNEKVVQPSAIVATQIAKRIYKRLNRVRTLTKGARMC